MPTPVQAKAIPPALERSDILATASTGTVSRKIEQAGNERINSLLKKYKNFHEMGKRRRNRNKNPTTKQLD